MKILHVIYSMNPASGGPCQGIRNSNLELQKLGVYREVLSLDDPSSISFHDDNFPLHALGPGLKPWGYNSHIFPWLLKNLYQYDSVIVNGLWQYHTYAVQKAFQELKRSNSLLGNEQTHIPKLYVMPHGMLDPYFQRAPDRKLKALRNWIFWKIIENKIVNQADALLFTCETELLVARETFSRYKPKKEINVGYGIEAPPAFVISMQDAFSKICPGIIGNFPYLLFLSRVDPKKGVDLLLKAYLSILDQRTTLGMATPKLVIAGPGMETQYGQQMKRLVQKHKQGLNAVLFPGMISGDAKWGAFYGCEAFVLPSHQENFGIAVAEALACSKPVLISNQINIWREIEKSEAGIIGNDTLEGAIEILKKWLSLSVDHKSMMSNKASECFQNFFTIEPAAHKFYNAIKRDS